MKRVALILSLFFASPVLACEWTGALGPGGVPILRECPADVLAYIKRDHACQVQGGGVGCSSRELADARARLFRKHQKDPTVIAVVNLWRSSALTKETSPRK